MARKNWVDRTTQNVLPVAFVLRPAPKDPKGLSLDVDSPESCASSLNECFGVVSLHVGKVRDIGLDVVIDESPHANIKGLPRREEDAAAAERFASLLAKQARLVPP